MRVRRFLPLVLVAAATVAALLFWKRPERIERSTSEGTPPATQLPTPEAADEAGAAGRSGAIRGTLRPPRHAVVHYYDYGNGDAPLATTETSEDGTFRFPESVAERGVLLAEADGFRPGWLAMHDLGAVSLVLEPGGPFSYQVTDPEGSPVPGAEVEVWHLFALSGHYTRGRVTTDERGVFPVNAGPEERLTITAEGFEPRTIPRPERADDPGARTIVLTPLLRIGGRVMDPLGQPLGGAEVQCREDNRTAWVEAPSVVADGQGRFETKTLPAKEYEIRASAEGWAEARARAWPGDHAIELKLDRPARLEGRVLLPGGAPAVGVELWARDSDPLVHSGADGSFRLDGIPPGRVEIVAYWWGPVEAPDPPDETTWRCSWPFELKPGESRTGVELTLSGAYYSWVPLRLVDGKGTPLAGIKVDTGTLSTFGDDEIRTDANGFVLIRTEDAPGYETRFEFPAEGTSLGVDRSSRVHTLPPGTKDVVEVKLAAPVHVTFVVHDARGLPIPPEARPAVWLYPGGENAVAGDRVQVLASPDVGRSRAAYRVYADDFLTSEDEAWLPVDGQTIEVRLRPARAVLRGVVQGADGTPLAGAVAMCDDRRVDADASGAFEFRGLPAGPVVLHVSEPESPLPMLRRQIDVHDGMNDLGILRAPVPKTIRGRVTDPDGRPVSGARVETVGIGSPDVVAVTRADGVFFVEAAEPANVRLIARKPGFGAAVGGGGTDLSLTLPVDGAVRLHVPPEVVWSSVDITLPDGSEIRPVYGDFEEPDIWSFLELPPGPLTLEFVDGDTGDVVATCMDRETVVPKRADSAPRAPGDRR